MASRAGEDHEAGDGAGREDVEAVIHWAATDDGERLALTRIQAGDAGGEAPVVLVHGNFTHRGFWVTPDGFGLGPYLARRGHDVWVPELRGHGLSPKGPGFSDFTAEDHVRRDLPAVHRAVSAAGGSRPVWVGHSAGGLYLLGALSRRWIDPGEVQAAAVFGTQIAHGEAYLRYRPVARAAKAVLDLLGYLPAHRLGLGPEAEPAAEMKELVDWKKDGWVDRSGTPYREGLADLGVPLRAYAGAGDHRDPPEGCRELYEAVESPAKSFQLLGEAQGFSRDYGHAGMVASRAASKEVWPDLEAWIADQA